MKRLILHSLLSLVLVFPAVAQTADDLNEGTHLTYDSANDEYTLGWWSRSPGTYFIQQSDDLINWNYVPLIEPGNDGLIEWGFATGADAIFLRLKHTDAPTLDPWNDDFDSDGISNYREILLGMDPFADEGAFHTGGDDDGDAVINGEDAAPSDDSVGQVAVSITYPANNSTLD